MLKQDTHNTTIRGMAQLFYDYFSFVNPNRVCLCRDSADQLSHIMDFVINNLRYFAFIR